VNKFAYNDALKLQDDLKVEIGRRLAGRKLIDNDECRAEFLGVVEKVSDEILPGRLPANLKPPVITVVFSENGIEVEVGVPSR
jgi:hypothetical protein